MNFKNIRERLVKMLSAWSEGAPAVIFMNISRTNLTDKFSEIQTVENEVSDLEAHLEMRRDRLAILYTEANEMMVKVGDGVKGNADYGDDSALYGAMGYVRKSDRKSGLTRRTKDPAK